jgi:hypothetical protein
MPRFGRTLRKGSIELAPNWDLGPDLRRTGIYDGLLRQLTQEQVLIAKEIAVREFFDTGDYYNSIHGDLGVNRKGLVVGLVMADDFKANWAEHGWTAPGGHHIRGKRILQRAARRAGLRVRGRRRASIE